MSLLNKCVYALMCEYQQWLLGVYNDDSNKWIHLVNVSATPSLFDITRYFDSFMKTCKCRFYAPYSVLKLYQYHKLLHFFHGVCKLCLFCFYCYPAVGKFHFRECNLSFEFIEDGMDYNSTLLNAERSSLLKSAMLNFESTLQGHGRRSRPSQVFCTYCIQPTTEISPKQSTNTGC